MEKFAVDLDKVLDEFEFNEDHAEQVASMSTPGNLPKLSNSQCLLPKVYNQQVAPISSISKPDIEAHNLTNNLNPMNNFYPHDCELKIHQKPNIASEDSVSLSIQNDISQQLLQKRSNDNSYDKKLNQPNIKPSVSNVFNSLNEYINTPSVSLVRDEPATINRLDQVGKDRADGSTLPTDYQNILLPVKLDSNENTIQQPINVISKENDYGKSSSEVADKTSDLPSIIDEPERVYENVYIGTDMPKTRMQEEEKEEVKHTYENVDFDKREKSKDGVYECIYIGNQETLPETTTELETAAKKMAEQLKSAESTKLVFQNVQVGPQQTEPKTVGFSNIDDLSEEELNKYLAELEAEERANENNAIYKNVCTQRDNEDENEAPIFESVTIGELPCVSEEDLQEKAKKFPIIDYSKPGDESSSAIFEAKDEKSKSRKSKKIHEKVRKSSSNSDSTSGKVNEDSALEDVKMEQTVQDSKNNNVCGDENKVLEGDVAEDHKDWKTEKIMPLDASEVNKNGERSTVVVDNSKIEARNIINNTEQGRSIDDDLDRPSRPQTLDIVSTVNMIEQPSTATSGTIPGGSETPEVDNAEMNNRAPSPDASENSSTSGTILGKQPPFWIPDSDAPNCMLCDMKFTVIKRRHHCRACGKVLCSKCCNMKYKLEYQGNIDSRVCPPCYQLLIKAECEQGTGEWSTYGNNMNSSGLNSQVRQPNPNNPMEYCSTIPPLQQLAGGLPPPPTVMVPVGVLKREGSTKSRSEGQKSVMFSDGIRPGCDLTELDTSWELKPPSKRLGHKRISPPGLSSSSSATKRNNLPPLDPVTNSYIPHESGLLPPTVTMHKRQITYHDVTDQTALYASLINECESPVMFAINRNLYACVKITNLNCCVNRICWNVTSKGLACVGQDEVIFLVETLPDETQVPKDLLLHINQIYFEAIKGNTVTEYGVSIHQNGHLLGSREHAGFLFIRQTLQCLQKVILPPAPFLLGLLVHRWETPWAKVFPLRLVLRLGAEYRYYPCPLVSVRFRDAVYFEIGHTVMKLLADFRNYAYTLPGVRGLTIHMQERSTYVRFPKNRYDQVIKGLNNSNDHVLAYASNFSIQADSHLVCIQKQTNSEDESSYQTQAINIQNKPRKVTGASFIIINGALKSSMGLSAKSSIVEDGLMVQIMPEKMEALKAALKNMQDFAIGCGKQGAPEPDEVVHIMWVENDAQFNLGVKSPIDGKSMDGIPSIRVHNGTDYMGTSRCIRWTEVFIIKSDDHPNGVHDPVDINKLSENIARATCTALVKLLDLLATAGLTKLAVRTTIHPDNVGYEAGSEGTRLPPIYMNSLDNELIQVLQKAVQSSQDTHTVLELLFYVLETDNF